MFKKIDEFHSINEKQTCDFSPCPLDSEVEASHHYTVLPPARLWQCSHPQMGSLKSHVTYLFASYRNKKTAAKQDKIFLFYVEVYIFYVNDTLRVVQSTTCEVPRRLFQL